MSQQQEAKVVEGRLVVVGGRVEEECPLGDSGEQLQSEWMDVCRKRVREREREKGKCNLSCSGTRLEKCIN